MNFPDLSRITHKSSRCLQEFLYKYATQDCIDLCLEQVGADDIRKCKVWVWYDTETHENVIRVEYKDKKSEQRLTTNI